MNIPAVYTNGTDYGRDQSHSWDVFIVGFTYGSIEDHSRSSGRYPEQALAICLFEDGHFQAIRLCQLTAKEVPWNITPTISAT